MNEEKKKVIVIGAGFAGINVVKGLAKHEDLKVLLLDRRNYHLFQPLLYQVATAGLSPSDIATPIRAIFSDQKNVAVMMENVIGVDVKNRKVITKAASLPYDYLVMACGAKHSYFGHNEWEEASPGLKTVEQATEIRRRILSAFEEAEKETDPQKQKELMTFIIVGGGPTGVELAGAIAEIGRYTLESDFRRIDPKKAQVLLVEAGPRILAGFTEKLSAQAMKDLAQLGVDVRISTKVLDVNAKGIRTEKETIPSRTTIWAAGVQPSSLGKTLGVELDRAGRVLIEKDLSIKGYPEVFVLGDQASLMAENGKPLPGLASVAMQQGTHAAKNILKLARGEKSEVFHYHDKGVMATIGKRKAIAQIGSFQLHGFIAWLTWLLVHIHYLIGFKNRAVVLFEWSWSYLTFKKGARLITAKDWHSYPVAAPALVSPEEKK